MSDPDLVEVKEMADEEEQLQMLDAFSLGISGDFDQYPASSSGGVARDVLDLPVSVWRRVAWS